LDGIGGQVGRHPPKGILLRAGWRSSRPTVTEAAVGIPPDKTSENTLFETV
jgi:hypothetical protein